MNNLELVQIYNEECAKKGKQVILKVNQNWLNKFQKQSNLQYLYKIYAGIPYEIDNNVETYTFE